MKELLNIFNNACKKYIDLILVLLSSIGLYGILYIDKIVYGINYKLNSNPKNIIFIFLIFYAYKNIKKNIKFDKNTIFSLLFTLFISGISIIGIQLECLDRILFEFKTIIAVLCLSIDLFIIVYVILKKLNEISLEKDIISERKINIIGYCIIFLSGFLVFLAIYPGMFGYDSIYQLQSGLGLQETTQHYSVIYIYMISYIFKLGKFISGNYELGCAIQTIIQIIFLTYVSNKVCLEVYKNTKKFKLWLLSIFFFSTFTFYKVMVVSIAQDTIFAGFFILFFLKIMKYVTEKSVIKIHNIILIIIDILGICLFRNNGFYALVLILPLLFFIDRDKKSKSIFIGTILISLIIYKLITIFYYSSIGVVKNTDSIKEMSSVPSQQLGRVLLKNPLAYSDGELENLKKYYIDIEALKNACKYNPSIADKQKNQLNQKNVDEDKFGYIKLWTKIGLKDTKNYIEAFLYNNLGLWYPNKTYPDNRMYHPIIEYNNTDTEEYNKNHATNYEVKVNRNTKLPFYEKILNRIVNKNEWQKIPIISIIYNIGFYFVLLIFTIVILILRKKYNLLIPISLVVSYYLTLFMGPVSLFRYVFPIIMLAPIYISILLKRDFGYDIN